ncbi:MAG: DNA repair protein RecN [Bacteroidia bacterium]|jgi:DNA repair protein RecN (Recombination protein N)|nr:DNA repair protein RecN [Bacteroidia bacterium]
MLRSLHIQNYALIDTIDVVFPDNLAIITGETGAGKSILLGGLFLILGQRADTDLVTDKAKKCIVEGTFTSSLPAVKDLLMQNELDTGDEIIIRREVSPEGKSRAFINDTPVTLAQLKELTSRLIDIHSQHQTLALNESEFQMSVADAYARHGALLDEYRKNYYRYKEVCKNLDELTVQEQESARERDYLEYQAKELEEAGLKGGEERTIEAELELLTHAEQIKTTLLASSDILAGGENNTLALLQEVRNKIKAVAGYNKQLAEIAQRLESSIIEIKDIAAEAEGLEEKIHHDSGKAAELTARLETIYGLAHKHHVNTAEELLAVCQTVTGRLKSISSLGEKLARMGREKELLEEAVRKMAGKLNAGRKKIVPALEKDIQDDLAELGMPHAQFKIVLSPSGEFTPSGTDQISFLFSANKGMALREVEKVASGGELSRLMLVIKSRIAKLTELPTIIFDEIDTGVSGQIAGKVAELVLRISASIQVIMITHLPQIASRGNTHFLVYKEEKKNKTLTCLRRLSPDERVEEIARMISMGKPGASALNTAAELLHKK